MATRHLRDYLPAILLEESSKNPLIEGFLQIIETFLIGDTANKIHEIYNPHPATLIRAQVEVSSVALENLKLTLGIPADKPNPLRAGDTIQVTDVANQFSRIHYTTIEKEQISAVSKLKHVLILQNKLSIAVGSSIRLADVTESTRCFRVAPGHQISRGNRIVLSQNTDFESVEASGTVVDVDGDFIYLARGLSKTFTLDDKASPVLVRRVYEPIEKTIDDLVNLFDPWKTRSDLLPWLASVVGLDISPQWNEYQKRLLLSQIAGLHHRLGTKEAMLKLIDIYVPESRKGRVCIDDCESLYRLKINDDNHGQLDLLAQSIHYSSEESSEEKQPKVSLLHPTAIVADGTGHYYVADIGGAESDTSQQHPATIWKITESGAIVGIPIIHNQITKPLGLDIDASQNILFILQEKDNGRTNVLAIDTTQPEKDPTIVLNIEFQACGFCFSSENTIIFIAGINKKNGSVEVLRFQRKASALQYELKFTYELNNSYPQKIQQPISFIQLSENRFLIGDGKDYSDSDKANIFYVELSADSENIEVSPTPLIPAEWNLVFPKCMGRSAYTNQVLAIDTGLRNPSDSQAVVASVTKIYLLTLKIDSIPKEATVTQIVCNINLVHPIAFAHVFSGDYMLLARGNHKSSFGENNPALEYRSESHMVSLVCHFRNEDTSEATKTRKGITLLTNQSKPLNVKVELTG